MRKPSWALVTFASLAAKRRALSGVDGASAAEDGVAKTLHIASVDTRQVAASTGGMGKTMRSHM